MPDTIRPCQAGRPDFFAGEAAVCGESAYVGTDDRADRSVFPVHHMAALCVVGTAIWAALIAAGTVAIDIVAQLA